MLIRCIFFELLIFLQYTVSFVPLVYVIFNFLYMRVSHLSKSVLSFRERSTLVPSVSKKVLNHILYNVLNPLIYPKSKGNYMIVV